MTWICRNEITIEYFDLILLALSRGNYLQDFMVDFT